MPILRLLNTQFINAETKQLLATAEAVYVFVNAADFSSCAIPGSVRDKFAQACDYGASDQGGGKLINA